MQNKKNTTFLALLRLFFALELTKTGYATVHIESKYWVGCRCRPYSNYWGEYSQIIGWDLSPIPPGFRHPWQLAKLLYVKIADQCYVNARENSVIEDIGAGHIFIL